MQNERPIALARPFSVFGLPGVKSRKPREPLLSSILVMSSVCVFVVSMIGIYTIISYTQVFRNHGDRSSDGASERRSSRRSSAS